MRGGWFRCPLDAWPDKREKPWSEAVAIAELRWWEDQVRRGKEPKMPSRRFLEDLFGWSAHRVDKLRMSSDWLPNIRMVNPYLVATKNRPESDQSPTTVTRAQNSRASAEQNSDQNFNSVSVGSEGKPLEASDEADWKKMQADLIAKHKATGTSKD